MLKIVLVRHGESTWNKENRFTGWTDVDLSEKGISEAHEAGVVLKNGKYSFDIAFTSYLKRAIKTLDIVLDELNELWIPVEKSWKLNERHYGALQGLNKSETAAKFGEEQVKIWRRSYDILPPALTPDDPRSPGNEILYRDVDRKVLPLAESLKETVERVIPYWNETIWKQVQNGKKVIIAAHGNSIRALVKYLDGIDNETILNVNIPTGIPLVYELDDAMKVLRKYYLGDEEKIRQEMERVANQGKK